MHEGEKEISNHNVSQIMLTNETMYYFKLGSFQVSMTVVTSFITRHFEVFVSFIELSFRMLVLVSVFNDSIDRKENRFGCFFKSKT